MEGPNLPWITLYLFLYKFPTIFCQEHSTFLHVLSSILPRTDSEDYPENTVESRDGWRIMKALTNHPALTEFDAASEQEILSEKT